MWFKFILIVQFLTFFKWSGAVTYYSKFVNGSRMILSDTLRLNEEDQWQATLQFQEALNDIGWDFLAVRSNPKLDDLKQMFEAGYLEGYVTQKQIETYWTNMRAFSCPEKVEKCKYVKEYLEQNTKFIDKMFLEKPEDRVFYQAYLTYQQIRGIYAGYSDAAKQSGGKNLTFFDILSLTVSEDLGDVKVIMLREDPAAIKIQLEHCSALIRLLPDFSDIFIAHDTWNSFSSMYRTIKRYDLSVHTYNGTSKVGGLVPSVMSTFSGYPGSVSSIDDFYVLGSGIVAMETTNVIYNNKTYADVKANSQILESIRSITSNRLATTAKEWVAYYSLYNSGTYNNQWMIIDMKKFRPGVQPPANFFWLVETVPGYVESRDITDVLVTQYFFPSYNLPYFDKINNMSGNINMDMKYKMSHEYNHETYSRAMIFKREAPKVSDLSTMLRVMRFNDYRNDEYSSCPVCTPQPNPMETIAARGDLFPKNGKAPDPYQGHVLWGAIDTKITSWTLFSLGQLLAVSGPTTSGGRLQPFSWTKEHTNESHIGLPDTWDFPPVIISVQPHDQTVHFNYDIYTEAENDDDDQEESSAPLRSSVPLLLLILVFVIHSICN